VKTGKVIPFPKRPEEKADISDLLIRKKIISGEAELAGIFQQDGKPCSCYRLNIDDQSYYIFNLSEGRGPYLH